MIVDIGRLTEAVIRGQVAAAIIFVRFAMDSVGAGLGDYVEQAARRAAELRREAVGDDLKFLDGFERNGEVLGFERAEILSKIIVGGVRAVDNQAAVVALLAAEADAAAQPRNNLGRGRKKSHIAIIPTGEGKVFDAGGIEQLGDAGGAGVHDRAAAGDDFDGLRLGLERHGDVQLQGTADVDDDLLHGGDREAIGLGSDGVFTGRNVVERVGAVGLHRQFTTNASGRIRERQFGGSDGGVRGVKHSSTNGAVLRVLRERSRGREQRTPEQHSQEHGLPGFHCDSPDARRYFE